MITQGRKRTFDSSCFDLAELFLADEPALCKEPGNVDSLASYIQASIEEWIEAMKEEKGKR
jgi:hypothetical protein